MYLIFATVIVLVIVLFGSSILSMVKNYTTTSTPVFKIGNIWFITLFLINFTIILFVYGFYYYKSTLVGDLGPTGDKGSPGYSGNNCIISSKKNQC